MKAFMLPYAVVPAVAAAAVTDAQPVGDAQELYKRPMMSPSAIIGYATSHREDWL